MTENDIQSFAVIDAGTNSIKFHIGERAPGGIWRTVVDRAEVTRMGEGFGQERVIPRRAGARGGCDPGHGRRSQAAWCASDGCSRHRRPADCLERSGCRGRDCRTHRCVYRGDFRRGRRPPGLSGCALRTGRLRRLAGRFRYRRRQFSVHLRQRFARRRAFQRRGWRGEIHRALSPRSGCFAREPARCRCCHRSRSGSP